MVAAQQRLLQLRLLAGGLIGDTGQLGPPFCIVFEGWDASGKGGCIKRLVAPLDPRHVRVAQFAAPTATTRNATTSCGGSGRRFRAGVAWPCSTGPGTAGCWSSGSKGSPPRSSGGRAFREIVEFERTLADEGMIMVKFWMHLSDEEQLRRFQARQATRCRRWKLTDEDWRNREKRKPYERPSRRCSTRPTTPRPRGSWSRPRHKRWARVKVAGVGRRGHGDSTECAGHGGARSAASRADPLSPSSRQTMSA